MRTRLAAALVLSVLAVPALATPAGAHGDTIHFTVTALIDGHTKAQATWENDGDPVEEKVAATLSAVATDGRTVGPWPLVAVDAAKGGYTTALALPPGTWKVTVESGFPALGRGEAELTVTAVPGTAPSAAPTAGVTAGATDGASAPASGGPGTPSARPAAAPAKHGGPGALVLGIAVAVCSVPAVVIALLLRRRRAQLQR
ncbi:hypothetical protein [Kitasatospora paracochleata]|uniref:Uncharacterized protein n=1 Tax=Kitasatospora paracochleata TaxID=58354 RepID=A0ABT1J5G8_9ACTN|nr:hypothetical protein [Kitasatospora paracochleata]MCP2312681.1 hypothetical protein [Kitasatospora paracochleata]